MTSITPFGRPRSNIARTAILQAAFDVLSQRGYAGLTIEGVAQAAGAGKTTIYRWWPDKAALAVDAFFAATVDDLRLPDTSSASDDFTQQIMALGHLLRRPRGAVMAAMLAGGCHDAVLAQALGTRWLAPRHAWGVARMTRAQAEGQLRDGVAIGPALAVLYGPVYTPLLFGQPVPEADALAAILAIACHGVFAPI